jgi:hypothetical protein
VTAARALADVATDWVAVAADPSGPVTLPPGARGTFAGYGVDVPVSLDATRDGTAAPDRTLALPALVAGWLRERVDARRVRVRVRLVEPDLPVADCCREGADLVAALTGPAPVGLLVLGDGSNRHTDRAPAPQDDRAAAFDDGVAAALAAADPAALLALDTGLAAELGAMGRAAWQVLAGVALAVGGRWSGKALYDGQPFGVAYHVAVWDPPAIG